jgi:hypothetical protein
METTPKYITGDTVEFANESHILRSVDFAANTATLERFTRNFWSPEFVTVPIGKHKKFLDLGTFQDVLQRQIEYVTPRVSPKGKFKLSKKLLARLQAQ